MAWNLIGKRVAFARPREPMGTWSKPGSYGEFCVTEAMTCIVLPNTIPLEQGACSIVNPLSAVGLVDRCKEYKANAVIITAGFSQLSKMIIKILMQKKTPVILTVRKDEQVKQLEEEFPGVHVLNSSKSDFEAKLKEKCNSLRANVCIECVGGEMMGIIGRCIYPKGIILSTGVLSKGNFEGLGGREFIGRGIRLEGFMLPYWMEEKSLWRKWGAVKEA